MANSHQNSPWKDFAPLFSHQCRLRHLVRITAFNVDVIDEGKSKELKRMNPTPSPSHSSNCGDSTVSEVCYYYYTLHLTTMSAPFYKSEKVQGENPRWAELEMLEILNQSPSLVSKGVVVRIWKHRQNIAAGGDTLVTAWGVHFSGLVPIPMSHSSLTVPPSTLLAQNTIVFHMVGGACFTSAQCLSQVAYPNEGKGDDGENEAISGESQPAEPLTERESLNEAIAPLKVKKAKMCLAESEVRSSYTLPLLHRLRSVEQAIRKQAASTGALRERISAASMVPSTLETSTKGPAMQLGPRDSTTKHQSALPGIMMHVSPSVGVASTRAAKRQALSRALVVSESLRLCVSLLKGERGRKLSEVRVLTNKGQELANQNKERWKELKEQQDSLLKEVEHLKEWRHREFLEARDAFLRTSAHLAFRRRQLVSEMSLIYPILQNPNGGYTICGVKLPNSEDFGPRDEVMVSVALGYVAHAIQMISIFLHVPLRYPVVHLGSRSRISDLVADKISDGEREFPLFSRAKDKLQFKYGVYLLNKNVAQLRWYCGLPTQDLRATLPNLASLFYPKTGPTSLMEVGGCGILLNTNINGPPGNVDRSPNSAPYHCHRRSHSGSSHNLQLQPGRVRLTSSESGGGIGDAQPSSRPFERGHRVTRSAGGKGEIIPPSTTGVNGTETQAEDKEPLTKNQNKAERKDEVDGSLGTSMGSSLSYSLDKGLDEYEVIQRTGQHKAIGREGLGHSDIEGQLSRVSSAPAVDAKKALSHVGSDPLLGDSTTKGVNITLDGAEPRDVKVSTEAQRQFLHGWHLSGGPVQSDDDTELAIMSEETGQPLNTTSRLLCPINPAREGVTPKMNEGTEMRESLSSLLPSGKAGPHLPSVVASTSAEVDRLFASVASRTEALASRSTSFNLMRSRQGSTTEDGGFS